MKAPPEQLVLLAETLADHQGVTHWAISSRFTSKGDTFHRLAKPGADLRTTTYFRLLGQFAASWPDDLEWPSGVPRPSVEDAA